jgi:origin recognition complex subunit 4
MPPRRKAQEDSPDPLLIFDIIEPIGTSDEIVADRPTQPEPPTKRPRTSARMTAKSPVSSPSRSILTPARPTTQTRTRTPLSKSVTKPTPVRGTNTKETPRKTPAAPPTLGSSTKTTLPTPSRSRPHAQPKSSVKGKEKEKENVKTPTKRKNEDVFADSSPVVADAAISRETFLANEALKRQREARNFKYKGDANAPRQTRSGRVVVDLTEGDEVDEFGGDEDAVVEDEGNIEDEEGGGEPAEDEELHILDDVGIVPSYEEQPISTINPLSEFARQHITNILSTITSQHISTDPPPFQDEDQNEALQGLLKLLQGTVDRGEGNNAMVTGPRGVGKTRVRPLGRDLARWLTIQTVARAIKLLSSNPDSGSATASAKAKTAPIVVKLSGHVQTNDRLAIREMGRQIAIAEGTKPVEENNQEDEAAEGTEAEV